MGREGEQVHGFIKDYRKEIESDIWMMPPLYHRVWQWFKYMVNHEDAEIPMRDGSKKKIKRGQHLTSIREIAKGVGWYEGLKKKEPNPKTIDAILKFMEKTEMILIERGQGNRQYTLITLIKYGEYQSKKSKGNSKVTVDGEGREQQVDINKELKECLKNDIKDIVEYLNEKSGKSFKTSNQATQEFINARLSDGYTVEDFKKVIDTKVTEWTGTEQEQYIRPNTLFRPSNFEAYLNQKSKVVSMDKQKEFVKKQMELRDQEHEMNWGVK